MASLIWIFSHNGYRYDFFYRVDFTKFLKEDFVKEFSQHVHDYANELSVYVYELRVGENELEQSAQSCV